MNLVHQATVPCMTCNQFIITNQNNEPGKPFIIISQNDEPGKIEQGIFLKKQLSKKTIDHKTMTSNLGKPTINHKTMTIYFGKTTTNHMIMTNYLAGRRSTIR